MKKKKGKFIILLNYCFFFILEKGYLKKKKKNSIYIIVLILLLLLVIEIDTGNNHEQTFKIYQPIYNYFSQLPPPLTSFILFLFFYTDTYIYRHT